MKTVLIFVATLDGKITRWNNPHVKKWSSQQDKDHFEQIWDSAPLIVLGSKTFDADPIKPSKTHLLMIMTSRPEQYQSYAVEGQIEFVSAPPQQIFQTCKQAGYPQMLIAGGAHIATSFLKEKLIDELWLTVEPKIFGQGSSFVIDDKLDIELKLLSSEKVNERGTLINKYAVVQ